MEQMLIQPIQPNPMKPNPRQILNIPDVVLWMRTINQHLPGRTEKEEASRDNPITTEQQQLHASESDSLCLSRASTTDGSITASTILPIILLHGQA
jgi:DNA polymerase IIIc chi subunit